MAAKPKIECPKVKAGDVVRVCIGRAQDGDRGLREIWRDATVKSQEPDGKLNLVVTTEKDGILDAHLLGAAAKSGHYEAGHVEHLGAHRDAAENPALAWRTKAEVLGSATPPATPPAPASAPTPPAAPVAAVKPPPPAVTRTEPPPAEDADAPEGPQ